MSEVRFDQNVGSIGVWLHGKKKRVTVAGYRVWRSSV